MCRVISVQHPVPGLALTSRLPGRALVETCHGPKSSPLCFDKLSRWLSEEGTQWLFPARPMEGPYRCVCSPTSRSTSGTQHLWMSYTLFCES